MKQRKIFLPAPNPAPFLFPCLLPATLPLTLILNRNIPYRPERRPVLAEEEAEGRFFHLLLPACPPKRRAPLPSVQVQVPIQAHPLLPLPLLIPLRLN